MAATLVRTIVIYIIVVIGIRLMGKRQIGELQPGELVITIMISECASLPIQDLNRPLINGIISVFTLIILEILLSFATQKWTSIRKIMEGKPSIIIDNGKINQKVMKQQRFNIDDLMNNLRTQGIFNIEDIFFAILETDGTVSVMPKAEKQPATADMLPIEPQKIEMPSVIIDDGKVRTESLTAINMTMNQLSDILNSNKITEKNIYLMTADRSGKTFIVKKEE